MAAEDFDLASLAQYLHLTREQVSRLAERGKIPGRKLQGQWRFAEAEIHHWLEERIGASGESDLIQVEGVLDRGRAHEVPAADAVAISSLLTPAAIAVPLAARTRNAVLQGMVDLSAQTGWLWDPPKMLEAIRARENLHPTALDSGVALLHPRRPLASIVAEPHLALGVTSSGVPFGASGGQLTDIFFLICATNDREHLRILARLSRIISEGALLDALRNVGDAAAAHALLLERDRALGAETT